MPKCEFCKKDVDVDKDITGTDDSYAHEPCLQDATALYDKLKKFLIEFGGYIFKDK